MKLQLFMVVYSVDGAVYGRIPMTMDRTEESFSEAERIIAEKLGFPAERPYVPGEVNQVRVCITNLIPMEAS